MLEIRLCLPLDTVFFLITNREGAEKNGESKENQMTLFAKNGTEPEANGLMRRMVVALGMAALLLSSCAVAPRPNVFFDKDGATFSKNTPITIVTPNDITNTKSTLQVMLQRHGFQVRSAVAAKETSTGQGNHYKTVEQGVGYGSINSLDQAEREYTQENQNYSQQSYRKYGTEYLMSLMYVWKKNKDGTIFADDYGAYYFKSFVAEIASQETGEILMSVQYPRNPAGYEQQELLRDLAGRMSLCAEQGVCDDRHAKQQERFVRQRESEDWCEEQKLKMEGLHTDGRVCQWCDKQDEARFERECPQYAGVGSSADNGAYANRSRVANSGSGTGTNGAGVFIALLLLVGVVLLAANANS